jgi:bifunctional enzyme CysN/CysC
VVTVTRPAQHECGKRDPKGLCVQVRKGEVTGLTGTDAPYEPPDNPDLVLHTAGADLDELVARVIRLLDERSPPIAWDAWMVG